MNASQGAQPTKADALATIRSTVFAQLVGTMPPSTYDHLETALAATMEAIQSPYISWVFATLANTEASPTETGEEAYIVWNQDRSEAVLFTDIGREPGEPSAQDDALTASIGISGSVSSVLGEAFHEAFEDDEHRPVQRVPLATILSASAAP